MACGKGVSDHVEVELLGSVRLEAMTLTVGALLLSGAASGGGGIDRYATQDAQAVDPCVGRSSEALVTFEDERLELAVQAALGEDSELTCGLVAELKQLVVADAGIERLGGIENLSGLEELNLWNNAIVDITPLAGLFSLKRLVLGRNSISDVSALAGLTNLTVLQIRENEIGDILPLGGLTRLTDLDISHNEISDISALSGMTRLTTLRVYFNPLSDIAAMQGLIELSELHVHDLPDLATIRPLVENIGLASGDVVIVFGSNVCSEVRGLRDKGVRVSGCSFESLRHWWWAILLAAGLVAMGTVVVRRRNERRWAAWRAESS